MKDCIEFKGYKDTEGYGRVSHKGKTVKAHRLAYCQSKGLELKEIDGLVVMHSCDNPPCINPNHLSAGTHADNVADRVSKGRSKNGEGGHGASLPGEKNGRAKLDEKAVAEIRMRYVVGCRENGGRALARMYSVDPKAIRCVVSGETWKKT